MSLRCARSPGPAVLALVVASLLVPAFGGLLAALHPFGAAAAGAVVPAGSGARGPMLSLASQSASLLPGQPFDVAVALGPQAPAPSELELAVSVHQKLTTRSGFEQSLDGADDDSRVLSRVTVAPLTPVGGQVEISVPVATSYQTGAIDLQCRGNGSCAGVYPVDLVLQRQRGGELARIATFLTYAESPSTDPLRVALVLPISSPVGFDTARGPVGAGVAPPSSARTQALDQLVAVLRAPDVGGVPVTLAVDPHTVEGLEASGEPGHKVVAGLGALSGESTGDELVAQPYVPIDLGALVANGLTGEPTIQMARGEAVLAGRIHVDTPPRTWLASGPVTSSLAAGLGVVRAQRVVVPDTDVSSSPIRLGITQPFTLDLGHGEEVDAAASDGALRTHFSADRDDPVLAAHDLLADLAFVQSELPGAASARGVVAVPPPGWMPRPLFVHTLLAGLVGNPVVRAVTLGQYFDQVKSGQNGQPGVRRAVTGSVQTIGARAASQVARSRARWTDFEAAAPGARGVLDRLNTVLLAAESDRLTRRARSAGIAVFEHALTSQLANVRLTADRSITLTARRARIPITFQSSAGYKVVGNLSLSGDKFQFPQGATRRFVIDHSTNALSMEVVARTSGDLPLEVTLTAPPRAPGAPPLVIARGELTVRSTATSVVGIVLTLVAIAVLLVWWARTWMHRRAAGPRRSRR